MVKRTLYFGNPAYLHLSKGQLVVRLPEVEGQDDLSLQFKRETRASIPIEDLGLVVLDHRQITLTQGLMEALLENNVALVHCNSRRMPLGLVLNLEGHSLQAARFRHQIEASKPLKKKLWQQVVAAKLANQAFLLQQQGRPDEPLLHWAKQVSSGDAANHEARGAAHYWKHLFGADAGFIRDRNGAAPNPMLNYGYAILRAMVARSLVGSGLLPTLGIFHSNQYNAYALADDVMEPYRPFVDGLVVEWLGKHGPEEELSLQAKAHLLRLPELDVALDGQRSPLMVAVQRTTASLAKCFEGEARKLLLPTWVP